MGDAIHTPEDDVAPVSARRPTPIEDDDDDVAPVPWLWGGVGLIAVVILAVLLFRDLDFGSNTLEVAGSDPEPAAAATVEDSNTETSEDAEPDVESVDDPTEVDVVDAAAEVDDRSPLMDRLVADGRFDRFISFLEDNDLVRRLEGDGPFTVFAPVDEAFEEFSAGGTDASTRRLLFRHIAGSLVESDALSDQSTLAMLDGSELAVDAAGNGRLTVDGVEITEPDIRAVNGVIHVTEGLFAIPLPGLGDLVAADPSNFNTLQIALDATGLTEALGEDGLVLLAPTEQAFGALPSGVVSELVADTDRLADLLRGHILIGPVVGDGEYETLAGDIVEVAGDRFGGARRVGSPRTADRGASLVPIDTVLVPSGFALADVNDVIGLEPIEFEAGSAEITPAGEAQLDRAIEYLLDNPVDVEIGGHTDSNGGAAANQTLSEERADAVVEYLVGGGIDAGRLTAVGYGESEPVADNATSAGRAQNRRIEFTILG